MSNKVIFYTLSEQVDKFEFAVKLVSQLWRKEQPKLSDDASDEFLSLWMLCDSTKVLKHIDELLWRHQQDSFIPHKIIGHYTEFDAKQYGITLSMAMPVPQWQGIIINLSPYPVTQFKSNHIVEIIAHDTDEKVAGRERYKHYKKLAFSMQHHQIELQSSV